MRKRLKNHSFSLISSNCIGGILYHDVGEQFRTPTINLIIPQFVTFAENLRYYLQAVSYTHLDVYKRQEVDHEKLLSDPLQHCPDFKFDWG